MKQLMVICALLAAGAAGAMERADLIGLAVTVIPIEEPVHVEGVAMRVSMVTGPDVGRLVARIEARWRGEHSVVQRHEVAGWQVLSRFGQGWNEVVQWRGEADSARLLHSRLDAMRPPSSVAPPFRLPPSCAWGGVVSGRAESGGYEQRTAICADPPREAAWRVRERLLAQGWSVRGTGPDIEAARDGGVARLVVSAGPGSGHSTLVWLAIAAERSR
jgi:hypothetical protein